MIVMATTPNTLVELIGRGYSRRSAVELMLLPLLGGHLLVETREHPTKQAETRLLTPAVRVAGARAEPGGFHGSGDNAKNDVACSEGEEGLLHAKKCVVLSPLRSSWPLPPRGLAMPRDPCSWDRHRSDVRRNR
jgi:hypothetical protein